MRVVGGHDYYDSARAYGEDRELVFERNKLQTSTPVEVEGLKYPRVLSFFVTLAGSAHRVYGSGSVVISGCTVYFEPVHVWFAGKRYAGVRVVSTLFRGSEYFWNAKSFMDFCAAHGIEIALSWRHPASVTVTEALKEYFSAREAKREELDALINNRIAIAISVADSRRDEYKWHINTDGLSAMKFASVINPYQAYQELSMFVGGVIPRQSAPTVELQGEKIMLQKHGMDEWSFKKPSNKS